MTGMAVMTAAATARPVTRMAGMTAMLGKRDRVILRESTQEGNPLWIINNPHRGFRECLRQCVLLAREASREEARHKELSSFHNGLTVTRASSSGCHSKKPEHFVCSRQSLHAGANLRFLSEIEAIARLR